MSTYHPDNWVVIFINSDTPHYRVLAGWSGGYTQGDSWKLNSGITGCTKRTNIHMFNDREYTSEHFDFTGSSGSVYSCHKDAYGLRMNNAYIWNQLQDLHGDKVIMMDEDTDWVNQDWIIGK